MLSPKRILRSIWGGNRLDSIRDWSIRCWDLVWLLIEIQSLPILQLKRARVALSEMDAACLFLEGVREKGIEKTWRKQRHYVRIGERDWKRRMKNNKLIKERKKERKNEIMDWVNKEMKNEGKTKRKREKEYMCTEIDRYLLLFVFIASITSIVILYFKIWHYYFEWNHSM